MLLVTLLDDYFEYAQHGFWYSNKRVAVEKRSVYSSLSSPLTMYYLFNVGVSLDAKLIVAIYGQTRDLSKCMYVPGKTSHGPYTCM